MQFKYLVQYLGHKENESGLHVYDFLSLEYNLPFSVYSQSLVTSYEKLKLYEQVELPFDLVLAKDNKVGIKFKVKPVQEVKHG